MSTYQIAANHDNAAGLLGVTDDALEIFEPSTPAVRAARILTTLGPGQVARGHLLTSWDYDPYLTLDRWQWLLERLTLRSAGGVEYEYREVTVQTPGPQRDWRIYNAIITHPHPRWLVGRGRFEAVSFPLMLLEDITP